MRSGSQEKRKGGGREVRRGEDRETVPSALPALCQPLGPWWSELIHYTVSVGNRWESEAKKRTVDLGEGEE